MRHVTVLCPDPDVDEAPFEVGAFESVERAEMWLEADHCTLLGEQDGEVVRLCAEGATADEHLYRFGPATPDRSLGPVSRERLLERDHQARMSDDSAA